MLLEDPINLPAYFLPYRNSIMKWHDFLTNNSMTPLEGALCFILSLNSIDRAIVGVTSLDHLIENKTAFDRSKNMAILDYTRFAIYDEELINPTLWSF